MPLQGLPGGAEVWKVDGETYAVYFMPGSNIPMLYRFERDDLREAAGATKPDKTLTRRQADARGAVNFGVTSELDSTLGQHPWDSFISQIERDVDIAPWLADPEVLSHVADAWIRGETPDLQRTEWWQSRTDQERRWLEQASANPTQARQELEDSRRNVQDALRQSGATNVSPEIVNLIADSFTHGRWSQDYAAQQIAKLSDPYATGTLDREIRNELGRIGASGDKTAIDGGSDAVRQRIEAIYMNRGLDVPGNIGELTEQALAVGEEFLRNIRINADHAAMQAGLAPGGFNQTRQHEDTVRDTVQRWLGPLYGNWSENEVRAWAGRLRNDPNAQIELEQHLRGLRRVAFPGWENEDTTYEQIASITRTMFQEVWGQTPDETDQLFQQVANMTDHAEAVRVLRREGLDRGIGNVVQDAAAGILQSTGGSVRRSF